MGIVPAIIAPYEFWTSSKDTMFTHLGRLGGHPSAADALALEVRTTLATQTAVDGSGRSSRGAGSIFARVEHRAAVVQVASDRSNHLGSTRMRGAQDRVVDGPRTTETR